MGNLNLESYIGKTIGNFKIFGVYDAPPHLKDGRKQLDCLCLLCNKRKKINYRNVLGNRSKSCGCLHFGMKQPKKYNKYIDKGEYLIGICSSGLEFLIDKEDFENIKNYTWHEHEGKYIRTCIKSHNRKNTYAFLHSIILGDIPKGFVVDHINGNPFDNRRVNLRVVKQLDNMKNLGIYSNNTSGQKGVCYLNKERKWFAYITYDKKRINLGKYTFKEDAIRIRKEAELKYFGEFNRSEEDLHNGQFKILSEFS